MKLTAEQTWDLPFPVGCPVWYNLVPEGSTSDADPPLMKRGVVESVSFDHRLRDMVYEVVYNDCEQGTAVDTVPESNLAYAAQCPVTIDSGEEGSYDGTVLLCEPDPAGTIKYTVMVSEGSQARFEDGVDAKRVRHRKVAVDATGSRAEAATAPAAAAAMPADQPCKANDGPSNAPDEEVPSSITCDSVGENQSGSGNRRHTGAPLSTAPVKKAARSRNDDLNAGTDRRSISSYSHGNASHSTGSLKTHLEMTVPLWLQRDQRSQRELFFHLIGSKDNVCQWKRTVSHIERETNCLITVNFDSRTHRLRYDDPAPPITMTVDTHTRQATPREVNEAREKLYGLLLDYLDVDRDEGAKGRLIYELAVSEHREERPHTGVVQARDPFGFGSYMSVVELPFTSQHGRRSYHAKCVLQKQILVRIKKLRCLIKVCDITLPVASCNPYVLVVGTTRESTDIAVHVVREALERHLETCTCGFL